MVIIYYIIQGDQDQEYQLYNNNVLNIKQYGLTENLYDFDLKNFGIYNL
jgi:hypothetical protein